MFKLAIIDDEPLALAGITSMVNWESLGMDIVGTAVNGQLGYELISRLEPDLVITDIKMPILSGMEMIARCQETLERCPRFIVLTSYEDVPYLREAIKRNTLDYLIKLELTEDLLTSAIEEAKKKLFVNDSREDWQKTSSMLKEVFFIRLLNNMLSGEREEDLRKMAESYGFTGYRFFILITEISHPEAQKLGGEDQSRLLNSVMQIIGETLGRQHAVILLPLSVFRFAILLGWKREEERIKATDSVKHLVEDSFTQVEKFFSTGMRAGMGRAALNLHQVSDRYLEARSELENTTWSEDPSGIRLFDPEKIQKGTSSISQLRDSFQESLERSEAEQVNQLLLKLENNLKSSSNYIHCLDSCCSVMHTVQSVLSGGEELLEQIFKDHPSGYQSVYDMVKPEQAAQWLQKLRLGLVDDLAGKNRGYSQQVADQVKRYLDEHFLEDLDLKKIAKHFSMSPNYLSSLFKKQHQLGITAYHNLKKIRKAQDLLRMNRYRIYEVSEMVGFESPFYFSKVFKRVTGTSPRQWLQTYQGQSAAE